MADMGTPANTASATASPEVASLHAAAVAFSKAAGDKMKSSDLAVSAAKAALASAVKVQAGAHAEATAANVVLAAADAAANGVRPSTRWLWIAAAVCAAVIVAAAFVHFIA